MSSVIRGSDDLDTALVFTKGQTPKNLTASRVIGTIYTNNTGQAIFVNAIAINNTAGGGAVIFVDGVARWFGSSSFAASNRTAVCGIVPAGSTYQVTAVYAGSLTSLEYWTEYRA